MIITVLIPPWILYNIVIHDNGHQFCHGSVNYRQDYRLGNITHTVRIIRDDRIQHGTAV